MLRNLFRQLDNERRVVWAHGVLELVRPIRPMVDKPAAPSAVLFNSTYTRLTRVTVLFEEPGPLTSIQPLPLNASCEQRSIAQMTLLVALEQTLDRLLEDLPEWNTPVQVEDAIVQSQVFSDEMYDITPHQAALYYVRFGHTSDLPQHRVAVPTEHSRKFRKTMQQQNYVRGLRNVLNTKQANAAAYNRAYFDFLQQTHGREFAPALVRAFSTPTLLSNILDSAREIRQIIIEPLAQVSPGRWVYRVSFRDIDNRLLEVYDIPLAQAANGPDVFYAYLKTLKSELQQT